jgi:hypothetical protein
MTFAIPTVNREGFCVNMFNQAAHHGFIYIAFHGAGDSHILWGSHLLIAEESKLLCMCRPSPWHHRFDKRQSALK